MVHTHAVTVYGAPIGTLTVNVRTVLLGGVPIGTIHKGAAGYGFTPFLGAPIGPATAKTIKTLLLTLGTKLAFKHVLRHTEPEWFLTSTHPPTDPAQDTAA